MGPSVWRCACLLLVPAAAHASLCSVTRHMVEPFAGDCSVAQTCLQFLAYANWKDHGISGQGPKARRQFDNSGLPPPSTTPDTGSSGALPPPSLSPSDSSSGALPPPSTSPDTSGALPAPSVSPSDPGTGALPPPSVSPQGGASDQPTSQTPGANAGFSQNEGFQGNGGFAGNGGFGGNEGFSGNEGFAGNAAFIGNAGFLNNLNIGYFNSDGSINPQFAQGGNQANQGFFANSPVYADEGFFADQPFIQEAGFLPNQGFYANGGFFYLGLCAAAVECGEYIGDGAFGKCFDGTPDTACDPLWVGDGQCDEYCNIPKYNMDDGDCEKEHKGKSVRDLLDDFMSFGWM